MGWVVSNTGPRRVGAQYQPVNSQGNGHAVRRPNHWFERFTTDLTPLWSNPIFKTMIVIIINHAINNRFYLNNSDRIIIFVFLIFFIMFYLSFFKTFLKLNITWNSAGKVFPSDSCYLRTCWRMALYKSNWWGLVMEPPVCICIHWNHWLQE